jgi:hypothetical protein
MSTYPTTDGVDAPADANLLQIQNRLWQLTTQLDQLQSQVVALRVDADQSTVQVNALVESLTTTQLLQPVHERLATLITALDATQEQLTTLGKSVATVARTDQLQELQQRLAQSARQEQVDQLLQTVARQPQLERLIEVVAGQAVLDELADSVKKLTRTQFKANTLAESKEQQIESALNTLREIATHRTPAQAQPPAQNGQQLATARREARAEFAAELLPALDSVELAYTNGLQLLEWQQSNLALALTQVATPPAQPLAPAPSFWQRVLGGTPPPITTVVVQSGPDPQAVQAAFATVKDAFTAWLRGLELVSDRFAALLAKEEIQSIEALQHPFDPRLHVAVETEERSDVESNTVVRVLRKGYRQQQRVLRYAEVVVARAPKR